MAKLTSEQQDEISRCAVDFPYFCEEYVKICVQKGSQNSEIVPFKLHPYQVRLYEHLEDNRFTIFSKFRQGGFTTELAIYGLWKCLFRLDQKVLWLAKTDREAVEACDRIVKRALEYMPDWMKGSVMKMINSHQKSFPETDSNMFFGTPEAACGKAISLLIIDEATHIKDMQHHWQALYPTLSTGGNCVVLSTPHKDDEWFWNTLEDASLKLNKFSVYKCHYKERPEHCDSQWEVETKSNLGCDWEVEYEQKVIETMQPKVQKASKKKIWRSIWDEWEGVS